MADLGGTSVSTSRRSTTRGGTFGGKTVSEWDCEWQCIGKLKDANLTPYNSCVGLYRHVVNGTTKYVGRAIELNNGGFRKRLSDYRRESNSARKHASGRTIYENLDRIETYILVVGNTYGSAFYSSLENCVMYGTVLGNSYTGSLVGEISVYFDSASVFSGAGSEHKNRILLLLTRNCAHHRGNYSYS